MIEVETILETYTAERAELAAVLSSESFRRAPTLARMLDYLCNSRLNGETFVKEYEIATEVLGRHSDFDPQQDGSVRVNLHHLRKKLKHFYETQGAEHTVHITLPVGQNLPSFVVVDQMPAPVEYRAEEAAGHHEESLEPAASLRQIEASGMSALDPEVNPPAEPLAASAQGSRSRKLLPLLLSAAIVVGLCLGVLVYKVADYRHTSSTAPPAVISDAILRIAAGSRSAYVDNTGRRWEPDAYFTGGTASRTTPRPIVGALDPTVYQNGREGDFSYAFPLPMGQYELHLHFADTRVRSEGFRTMSVAINGNSVEQYLDIVSDAGGAEIATEKVYSGVTPGSDGMVHLEFKSRNQEKAFVNAIEIFPGNGSAMRPIHQSTLSSFYFDPRGQEWTPDQWFHGGRTGNIAQQFPQSALQGIYQSERFGNFSYSIPVVAGHTYTLTLYFQDYWFSHQPPGKKITGNRSFDVFCNGKELVHHLDILQETQVGDSRLTRHFSGLQPNSQGKLLLSFTPNQNYAMVNAIVVVDEADSGSAIADTVPSKLAR